MNAVDLKITELRTSNEEKLSAIQKDMNEKLDRSLNARLDESFKQIGERLESLYKSLGELRQLESGVSNLNRTLSNVKTRGIWFNDSDVEFEIEECDGMKFNCITVYEK